MKERPILFSGSMVRAILDGRKTMTRRVVKGVMDTEYWLRGLPSDGVNGLPIIRLAKGDGWTPGALATRCPYGLPGDRLWVRETWAFKNGNMMCSPSVIQYRADNQPLIFDSRWHPSIHMPRWSSRITLEIVSVRVERVQDISEDDAKAEGLRALTKDGHLVKYGIPDSDGCPGTDDHGWPWADWKTDPRIAFRRLWDSINSKRGYGWDANPLVWVVEFKRIEP